MLKRVYRRMKKIFSLSTIKVGGVDLGPQNLGNGHNLEDSWIHARIRGRDEPNLVSVKSSMIQHSYILIFKTGRGG